MSNHVSFESIRANLRNALLLSIVADLGLLIRTDSNSFLAAAFTPFRADEERTLARSYDGNAIRVLCSFDTLRFITNAMMPAHSTTERPDRSECAVVMLQPPERKLPEAIYNRLAYSVDVKELPPQLVKKLVDKLMESDEFSPDNIAALRAKYEKVLDGVDHAFFDRVAKACSATNSDSVEFRDRCSVGIDSTFGYGLCPRTMLNLVHICAAEAVIEGRDCVREADLVKHFVPVAEHAIAWGTSEPKPGSASALRQIAEWAVSR